MSTKVVTAHLPVSLADRVDAMAERLERSRGWIVRQALSAWVDLEDERHRMTLEALEDVDAGRLVTHDMMREWAENLSSPIVRGKPLR